MNLNWRIIIAEKESIESKAKLLQSGYSFFSLMSDKDKTNEQVMKGVEATYNALCQNPNWQNNPDEGIITVVNAIEDEKIRKVYQSATKAYLKTIPKISQEIKKDKVIKKKKTSSNEVNSPSKEGKVKSQNVPMMIYLFYVY